MEWASTLDPNLGKQIRGQIHEEDLAWLEETFSDYNASLGYPAEIQGLKLLPGRAVPSWAVSRRLKWRLRQKPVRHVLSRLGLSSYKPLPQ